MTTFSAELERLASVFRLVISLEKEELVLTLWNPLIFSGNLDASIGKCRIKVKRKAHPLFFRCRGLMCTFSYVTFYSCHKYMVLLLVFSPFGRKHIYIIWHFSILKLNCFKKLSSLLRKHFPTFKKLTNHDQDWSYSQIVHHHHRWQPWKWRAFLNQSNSSCLYNFQ